jgi:hypothetical protein
MIITHNKLIALGLAFGILGSTSAFARPAPHFENGVGLHTMENGVVPHAMKDRRHFPTSKMPSASTDKDGWPANMILG